jgi:hypothetical protein
MTPVENITILRHRQVHISAKHQSEASKPEWSSLGPTSTVKSEPA